MTSIETPAAGMTRLSAAGPKPLPPHGTLSRCKYHKCRCQECRDAYNAYQRTRYRKIGYGTWQPLVDAEPARQHLLSLKNAGFSIDVIAASLGQWPPTLNAIVYPVGGATRQRIKRELATTILAATPDTLAPAMLPAIGSARRIYALIAQGWTTGYIAQQIGVRQPRVSEIARQQLVTRTVADRIVACYERLQTLRPEDHGVSATASLRSRRLAERRGWPDPVWWEDMGHIDDPAFDPATAEQQLNFHERAALRAEEILHLASYGTAEDEIARRLGLGKDYVVARLRELREVAA